MRFLQTLRIMSVMNILIVEDEPIQLEGMVEVVRHCEPQADIVSCENAEDALAAAERISCDIAFLDIELPGKDGLSLAKQLKSRRPQVNIIFTTAYPHYTGSAMDIHASGYILKPVTEAKVRHELDDLRHPVNKEEKKLVIQAFGNFEVFFRGKPVPFRYSKTKEMLAYLTDRMGALVTGREIRAVLWEDSNEDKSSYYKQLRKDLFDTLRMTGCENAVIGVRGALGIIPENVVCDYYNWLKQTSQATSLYHGEYMQQYSWAETTHGSLEMRNTNTL